MTTRNKATDFKAKYTTLIADVRTLKLDLESMAHQSSDREKHAFFDAADMTKSVLEADERR